MNSQITTAAAPRSMRLVAAATALAMSVMSFGTISSEAPAASADELVDVIVRAQAGATDAVRSLVNSLGGSVELDLGIINGFSADVPADAIAGLVADSNVVSVTADTQVRLQQTLTREPLLIDDSVLIADSTVKPVLEPVLEPIAAPSVGNLDLVRETIQADKAHDKGYTGQGIDVALIDSGVVPVAGLDGKNLAYGPDLSFEADYAPVTNMDTFGHGTHMAGIIAANGGETTGIAPGARIISVKVADATGAVDVSQIIAGIDWVVSNRNTEGRNIRVLNLSFGTDSKQSYRIDPLAYAVEVAWNNDIVVVASAGNHGDDLGRLSNPAIDPFVIAVGATNTNGTAQINDDTVPSWSAVGNADRSPDVAAPGRSIESLRSPGSWIDANNSSAQLGRTMFKGSGTSQAAAVTSGAVALMLSANPKLTNDQVKAMLIRSAAPVANGTPETSGAGTIRIYDALSTKIGARKAAQRFASSDGSGSLEAARGSHHVVSADGQVLTGEVTVNGAEWTGSTWAGSTWAGSTWAGSTWAGSTWAGSTWAGSTWAGSTWAGSTWAGSTWAGSTWAGSTWAGSTWASTAFWAGLRWE